RSNRGLSTLPMGKLGGTMHYNPSTFSTLFSAGRSNQDSGSICGVLLKLRRPRHGLWGHSRD
ncbi:MAG: hypothetical protein V3T61_01135, partial [Acidobacteriota bacterium]